ncbi:glycoside hydrolase family 5 protein [Xanthomonas maliensis]|uniref:glycoside hydrolase family 5 protein n=1 Tax=Xanthomonas maliensis TaxID=1321368 RepID=UPI0005704BF6|nr:glycoside hydrolase family 5 protein [Xanthomonas maliensis]KAB7766689.1 cellulase [Xanthomonas maliensis]
MLLFSPSAYRRLACALIALCVCSLPLAAAAQTGNLRYAGVNLSGAEIQSSKRPGVPNVDYHYPSPEDYRYFASKGMNIVRLPILWERLQPQPGTALDAAQLAMLRQTVADAKAANLVLIVDVHNYARYYGHTIGSAAVPVKTLTDLWRRLAAEFRSDDAVIFGLMNEPYGISPTTWAATAQATIDSIRATGANNLILVPGALWSGAHSWYSTVAGVSNAEAMASIHDPLQRYAIEVHQYLDADSSGTSATCTSASVGAERLRSFVDWLRRTNKRGFLGEFGAANNAVCRTALDGMLAAIQAEPTLWLGWSYWAAGAWWRTGYPYSVQPDADGRDKPQMAILAPRARQITGR